MQEDPVERPDRDDLTSETENLEDPLSVVSSRPQAVTQFWADAGVDPIEVALPGGVGYTLRSYLAHTDGEAKASATPAEAGVDTPAVGDEATPDERDIDDEEGATFLAHDGTLYLFRSPEGLVEFLISDAPHDLQALEGWEELAPTIRPEHVIADSADRYELDLVVGNLRGGHDAWEPELLISAGEFARDLAYACHLDDVLTMLAPGSPLDDLDEGLRGGGFFARRRLRKIGAEQAALAWRTVIGRLAAAVEWRD
jgi:hypothetical protein